MIAGAEGVFSRLKNALKAADTRRVKLNSHVHDELNIWRHFIELLVDPPMHLREHPLAYTGGSDASLTGMGGIFHSPSRHHFLWRLPLDRTTDQRLLSDKNPDGYTEIIDIELEAYIAHLHNFSPIMAPLEHNFAKVDNTMA